MSSEKIVLITGASSGIGAACAELFGRHGYRVICLGRNQKRLAASVAKAKRVGAAAGSRGFIVDLEKTDAAQHFFHKHIASLGRLDCLINSAGIAESGSFQLISDKEWERIFRVNVTASFAMCRESIPYLQKSKAPSIVNIASIAGRLRSISLGAHYSASKAAIIGMTRHLAAELGPRGIRINAVCPGQTHTPMLEAALSKQKQKKLAQSIPLKRLAKPQEQAEVIYFLASPQSTYIHGAIIDVNGGML